MAAHSRGGGSVVLPDQLLRASLIAEKVTRLSGAKYGQKSREVQTLTDRERFLPVDTLLFNVAYLSMATGKVCVHDTERE
jgi:hypothetical protein